MAPSACDPHCVLEVHFKNGPVGTVRLKVRDVGGELFNGRSGGRHWVESGSFRVLSIGSWF